MYIFSLDFFWTPKWIDFEGSESQMIQLDILPWSDIPGSALSPQTWAPRATTLSDFMATLSFPRKPMGVKASAARDIETAPH